MNYKLVSNLKDDAHCEQAVVKMILASHGRTMSFTALDRLLGIHPGQFVWSVEICRVMHKLGFESVLIESFDYERLQQWGAKYLAKIWSADTATWELRHTNIRRVIRASRNIHHEFRPATTEDISGLFARGFHVSPTMNGRALNNLSGWSGHVVLVTACDKRTISINDPGLPARRERRLSRAEFTRYFTGTVRAWKLRS